MGFKWRRKLLPLAFVLIVCVTFFQVAFLHFRIVDDPLSSPIDAFVRSSAYKRAIGENKSGNIPVFYNLFVANASDASRVMDIVSEQKAFLRPEYHKPFFVQSMGGAQLNIPDTIQLGHRANGSELITLHSLWDFCRENPQVEKVVYLHSKGSYTNSEENRIFRRFLTAGALSEECASVKNCNVCSSRFSPLPHPHAPGNMWLARCDYVRELIDPFKFEQVMNSITSNCSETYKWWDGGPWCDGRDRWSAEHWVHSHPSVKPCDLHKDPGYKWDYGGLPPNGTLDIDLAPAPRFDLVQYIIWDKCILRGTFLDHRLYEYWELYGKKPTKSWWGWNYLQTNRSFISDEMGRKKRRWKRRKDCWKIVTNNGTEIATDH